MKLLGYVFIVFISAGIGTCLANLVFNREKKI